MQYCKQSNIVPTEVQFEFDGVYIRPRDTPKTLQLEDGDIIDVINLPQTSNHQKLWRTWLLWQNNMVAYGRRAEECAPLPGLSPSLRESP